MKDDEWTEEWPTEEGYYWFYGWCFGDRNYPAELHLVRIHHCLDGEPVYVTDGHFLYKAEGGYGLWMPAEVPDPPLF